MKDWSRQAGQDRLGQDRLVKTGWSRQAGQDRLVKTGWYNDRLVKTGWSRQALHTA